MKRTFLFLALVALAACVPKKVHEEPIMENDQRIGDAFEDDRQGLVLEGVGGDDTGHADERGVRRGGQTHHVGRGLVLRLGPGGLQQPGLHLYRAATPLAAGGQVRFDLSLLLPVGNPAREICQSVRPDVLHPYLNG